MSAQENIGRNALGSSEDDSLCIDVLCNRT